MTGARRLCAGRIRGAPRAGAPVSPCLNAPGQITHAYSRVDNTHRNESRPARTKHSSSIA